MEPDRDTKKNTSTGSIGPVAITVDVSRNDTPISVLVDTFITEAGVLDKLQDTQIVQAVSAIRRLDVELQNNMFDVRRIVETAKNDLVYIYIDVVALKSGCCLFQMNVERFLASSYDAGHIKHYKEIGLYAKSAANFKDKADNLEIYAKDKITRLGYYLDIDLEDRLLLIERFANINGGRGIGDYIKAVFPRLEDALFLEQQRVGEPSSKLRWADRVSASRGQNPIPFLRTHYPDELKRGWSLGALRVADPGLGSAVQRWAAEHGLPDDLNLDMRTRQQRNDARLQEIETAKLEGRKISFSENEARRIASAKHRRRESE